MLLEGAGLPGGAGATAPALALALLLDAAFGDPDRLYRRVPHPVTLFGRTIEALDRRFNREGDGDARRRLAGAASLVALVAGWVGLAWALTVGLRALPFGTLLEALLASTLLAQRSLLEHVLAVPRALEAGGLAAGRAAVSRVVGRDPASLDEAGVSRAAIESAAENFSDGVVAPAVWFLLAGLPGLVLFKLVNTADSMIGHLSARHRAYGWAAARLDDALNLAPARLSALLLALAAPLGGGATGRALAAAWRDARRHRSPNAGWPEAAMAGALRLVLAGPRRYGGRVVDDPFLNAGGRTDAGAADIRRAVRVVAGACALLFAFVAGLALAGV